MISKVYRSLFKDQKINWIKTFIINFKCLPFSQAIHLPIFIYAPTMIFSIGKIKIESCEIKKGMIRIGGRNFFAGSKTVLINSGTIIFRGKCHIGAGTCITNTGIIDIGDNVALGENMKLMIVDKITIGHSTRFAFGTVVMDTDFHTIVNIENGIAKKSYMPIVLGAFNWIGNSCMIKKGTVTTDFTIVSSLSMLNKDYSGAPQYPILGGCPAKVISSGWRRLYENENNRSIDSFFREHKGEKNYRIPLKENMDWDEFCAPEGDLLYR